MNIVLLSGGSGTRLWPLSNEARSKQFLRLLKDADGNYQSMVQRVFGQIKAADLGDSVTIATSEGQVDSITNQLGGAVHVVTEPQRRNTFPAIALSCAHLFFNCSVDKNDVVAVLPVDPYAEIGYFKTLSKLEALIKSDACSLALMGVSPTFPTEKYGYMIPAQPDSGDDFVHIASFKEKPDEQLARELIEKGALWNCGVFAFKLGYLLNIVAEHVDLSSFEAVKSSYGELPKISFDYAVVEKENSICAVEYSGYWKDLGTWNTFAEEINNKTMGNVLIDSTCENTHVLNEIDIPIIAMGAKDMIIAASYDGILIADKHQSSYMKPLVEQLHMRPMYEERRWGDYRVLDYITHPDGSKCLTKRIFVKAGKCISYQLHHHRSEVWTITLGHGEFILNDERMAVKSGDVLHIPTGAKHGLRAVEDLELIEVQLGNYLEEDDIIRLDMDW